MADQGAALDPLGRLRERQLLDLPVRERAGTPVDCIINSAIGRERDSPSLKGSRCNT
jgi:hypothetical protein